MSVLSSIIVFYRERKTLFVSCTFNQMISVLHWKITSVGLLMFFFKSYFDYIWPFYTCSMLQANLIVYCKDGTQYSFSWSYFYTSTVIMALIDIVMFLFQGLIRMVCEHLLVRKKLIWFLPSRHSGVKSDVGDDFLLPDRSYRRQQTFDLEHNRWL